jgi:hypothetical protein
MGSLNRRTRGLISLSTSSLLQVIRVSRRSAFGQRIAPDQARQALPASRHHSPVLLRRQFEKGRRRPGHAAIVLPRRCHRMSVIDVLGLIFSEKRTGEVGTNKRRYGATAHPRAAIGWPPYFLFRPPSRIPSLSLTTSGQSFPFVCVAILFFSSSTIFAYCSLYICRQKTSWDTEASILFKLARTLN